MVLDKKAGHEVHQAGVAAGTHIVRCGLSQAWIEPRLQAGIPRGQRGSSAGLCPSVPVCEMELQSTVTV